MTLTIEFTPQEEAWLHDQATHYGLPPSEIVKRLVEERLPPAKTTSGIDPENAAAIALLDSWLEEDATDDPEQLRKAEKEFEELKRNLNANRAATGERLVFP